MATREIEINLKDKGIVLVDYEIDYTEETVYYDDYEPEHIKTIHYLEVLEVNSYDVNDEKLDKELLNNEEILEYILNKEK